MVNDKHLAVPIPFAPVLDPLYHNSDTVLRIMKIRIMKL